MTKVRQPIFASDDRTMDEEERAGTQADLRFRTDLYRGTAPFYDRYRPPYPEPLFHDLLERAAVSGTGRLLDLACGTGQIAFPLAQHFAEVVAVDQEDEFVAFGRDKAVSHGVGNIRWVVGSAEQAAIDGPFELIGIGNAFHRVNRTLVAERMMSWLQPGGAVALVWSDTPWRGDQPWQQALDRLFTDWMGKVGATDRVPAGWEAVMEKEPHAEVLRRAGFEYVGKFEFTAPQAWTVETLIGLTYSTSFLSREALGDRVPEFERDLARRLAPHVPPDGVVHETATYAYELARTPR